MSLLDALRTGRSMDILIVLRSWGVPMDHITLRVKSRCRSASTFEHSMEALVSEYLVNVEIEEGSFLKTVTLTNRGQMVAYYLDEIRAMEVDG